MALLPVQNLKKNKVTMGAYLLHADICCLVFIGYFKNLQYIRQMLILTDGHACVLHAYSASESLTSVSMTVCSLEKLFSVHNSSYPYSHVC